MRVSKIFDSKSIKLKRSFSTKACALVIGQVIVASASMAASDTREIKDSTKLEEVMVTARGMEQPIRDIPVAITMLDEKRLENLQLNTMGDVAATLPQLDLLSAPNGSGAIVSIRGIGANYTSIGIEQSVSTIVDGVYYPFGRSVLDGTFDARQIAVLKGPQALFFGKNATAGAVVIDTNNPGNEFEASGRIAYEFEQEKPILEGILSGPLTENLGIRLAVRATNANSGYFKNNAQPSVYVTQDAARGFVATANPNTAPKDDYWPGEESLLARLTVEYVPNDRMRFNIKGSISQFDVNSPSGGTELWHCPTLNGQPQVVVGGVPVPNPYDSDCTGDWRKSENPVPPIIAATNPLANRYGGELGSEYKSKSITGTGEFNFEKLDLSTILNYHETDVHFVGDFDYSGNTSVFAPEQDTFENLSLEIRGVTSLNGPVNFVGGIYYQNTKLDFIQDVYFAGAQNSAAANPANEYIAYNKISATDGDTFSLYGEIIWDISDRWQLAAGARYIDESKDSFFEQSYVNPAYTGLFTVGGITADQDFSELVPEVTVSWDATDDATFYAGYKEGWKSGGFSNSGILGAISGTASDFTFEPESVKGFEAGMKSYFLGGALYVEIEGYFYEFKDLQIDFFNSPTFANITTNVGKSETKGVEMQLNWTPADVDGLVVRGSIGYNDSEYIDFVAPCWAGQKPSQGCTIDLGIAGEVPKQQLAGTPRALSPKWLGMVGVDYDFEVGDSLVMGVTGNLQLKDDYLLDYFGNPAAVQDGYAMLDAAIRLGGTNQRWRVDLVGRNLTNKYALLLSRDGAGSGGGTGTSAGFAADLIGIPVLKRSVELSLTVRY